MAEQAEVSPPELKFRFQLNKQLPTAISIHNPTGDRLAFKVKTTTPKKYVVRPSSGVVDPRSTANVQVIMQAQKEIPADFASCKDKFLVQVKGMEADEEVTADTFKAAKGVKDTKIRVVLEGPPAPPSPVPEVNEGDEDNTSMRTAGGAAPTTDGFSSAAAFGGAAGSLSTGGDASTLSQENRALRAELQKLRDEKERLSRELKKADRGSAAGAASRGSGGDALLSASLLPVLIVGLLAFLVGHYLQHVPVVSQLLGKRA
ncbi:PapD-like protein [Scenedesmus sp. NREL 46B-D3]|nr:PapD-like protein [Scenedesmus sp. NREL 46B-D3]